MRGAYRVLQLRGLLVGVFAVPGLPGDGAREQRRDPLGRGRRLATPGVARRFPRAGAGNSSGPSSRLSLFTQRRRRISMKMSSRRDRASKVVPSRSIAQTTFTCLRASARSAWMCRLPSDLWSDRRRLWTPVGCASWQRQSSMRSGGPLTDTPSTLPTPAA
jgi:hypothetical protein